MAIRKFKDRALAPQLAAKAFVRRLKDIHGMFKSKSVDDLRDLYELSSQACYYRSTGPMGG